MPSFSSKAMNKNPCIFYRVFFPHLVQKNSTPLKAGKDKGNLIKAGDRQWGREGTMDKGRERQEIP
jgi:hypothetical protein